MIKIKKMLKMTTRFISLLMVLAMLAALPAGLAGLEDGFCTGMGVLAGLAALGLLGRLCGFSYFCHL